MRGRRGRGGDQPAQPPAADRRLRQLRQGDDELEQAKADALRVARAVVAQLRRPVAPGHHQPGARAGGRAAAADLPAVHAQGSRQRLPPWIASRSGPGAPGVAVRPRRRRERASRSTPAPARRRSPQWGRRSPSSRALRFGYYVGTRATGAWRPAPTPARLRERHRSPAGPAARRGAAGLMAAERIARARRPAARTRAGPRPTATRGRWKRWPTPAPALDPGNAEAEALLAGSARRLQMTLRLPRGLDPTGRPAGPGGPDGDPAPGHPHRLCGGGRALRRVHRGPPGRRAARFGYPRVHEDDARRAVLAGLEMVRLLGEQALEVRIAVHTGVVVVDAGDVAGAAPNEVARLRPPRTPASRRSCTRPTRWPVATSRCPSAGRSSCAASRGRS